MSYMWQDPSEMFFHIDGVKWRAIVCCWTWDHLDKLTWACHEVCDGCFLLSWIFIEVKHNKVWCRWRQFWKDRREQGDYLLHWKKGSPVYSGDVQNFAVHTYLLLLIIRQCSLISYALLSSYLLLKSKKDPINTTPPLRLQPIGGYRLCFPNTPPVGYRLASI